MSNSTLTEQFILQTYYYGNDQLEHWGYSRRFDTQKDAESYARNNLTGSRYTITKVVAE